MPDVRQAEMEHDVIDEDMVMACAHLVDRAGASGFEIGHLHDDVPVEEAGWYAVAFYQGARITADDHQSTASAGTRQAPTHLNARAGRAARRPARRT